VAIEIFTIRRLLVIFTVILIFFAATTKTVRSETPMETANRIAEEMNETESILGSLDAEIRNAEMQATEAQHILNSLEEQVRQTAIQRFVNNDEVKYDFTNPDFNIQVRAKALFEYATQRVTHRVQSRPRISPRRSERTARRSE
jgi:hypothetical protein